MGAGHSSLTDLVSAPLTGVPNLPHDAPQSLQLQRPPAHA